MSNQNINEHASGIKRSPNRPANTLPAVIGTARPRPSLRRHTIPADFLSQLIAEKNRMAAQRPKRRAPTSLANEAYRAGRRITMRHMPAGYGLTEIV